MVEKEDMLIFKLREKRQEEQRMVEQPARTKHVQESTRPKAKTPAGRPPQPADQSILVVPTTPESVVEEAVQSKKAKGKYEAKSREAASGLFCEWHPWRSAYAICYTCHKPYCYEDISEYNGRYYCLEDIDTASVNAPAEEAFEYDRLGFISAAMFLTAIFVYVFFLNNLLLYVAQNAYAVGLQNFFQINFVNQINMAYLFLFGGLILVTVEFIVGVMVLAQSRKAYGFGIFAGFLSMAAFSYIYVQNFQLYGVILAAMSFIGIMTLAYSKRAASPTEKLIPNEPPQPIAPYPGTNAF